MIKKYFKIAWRSLWKNKTFSTINILGLALGMACSLLILLWVRDEYSVDAFHANKNQLYRIYERQFFDNKKQGVIWTQGPLATELKKGIPEIEMATAFSWTNSQAFTVGNKTVKRDANAAGPDFFRMFSFKLLQGTPDGALKDINSLAISRKTANIFFGSPEAAMGKTMRYANQNDLMVTAVFEDIPANSTLKFECLRNWDAYLAENPWAKEWESNDPLTFFKVRADANITTLKTKLLHFTDNYLKPPTDKKLSTELGIQPFNEYYLNNNFKDAQVAGGRIEYVQLFAVVAIFILLIACINFMNLATARSAKRAKEVGVRKVVGAQRWSLIGQFISEAILLTVFSIVLSILLVAVLLPLFNQLTGKQMSLPITDFSFWSMLVGLTFFTGLISGSYPAFFLSSLAPIKVLKGSLKFDGSSVWLRKGLVVFQFSLSIILIIGMIVIYRQVNYVQNVNLGYEPENLVYFPIEGKVTDKFDVFKEQVSKIPGVKYVSYMTDNPTDNGSGADGISWPTAGTNPKIRFTPVGVGYDFTKAMNIKMALGRDFSKNFLTDTASFIINETALKTIGMKDPIGQYVTWGNGRGKIIGVLKDFHYQSLRTPIRPLIAYLRNKQIDGNVLVSIEGSKTKEVLAQLQAVYKTINPDFPLVYNFASEEYAKLYKSEQVISKLSNYFAFIAIFISCLGLLGLAIFTAEQRKKEIGIRKVLGATVAGITSLLSRDFVSLVLVAIVIASPVAWYLMHLWLQNFAYKINISWWIFFLAGMLALLIALLTVSFQAVKAALMNPVRSLKSE